MRTVGVAILMLFLAVPSAYAGGSKGALEKECENGLKVAYREIDFAKAKGLEGTAEYAKAATLLTGAKIQQGFGKYPNCIDKVRRARAYIARSRRK